jgi:hypothetical protein
VCVAVALASTIRHHKFLPSIIVTLTSQAGPAATMMPA